MHLGDFEKNIGLMPAKAVNKRCYRTVLKMCQKDTQLVNAKFHYASLFGASSELAPNRFGACYRPKSIKP